MDSLNTYQKICVTEDGHLLIMACPGSGKTTVLSYRAARLLKEDPTSVLMAVTFTKDAADELKARIVMRANVPESRIIAGTFHSLGLKLIKQAGLTCRILDESVANEFIQSALDDLGEDDMKVFDVKRSFSAAQSSCNPDNHPAITTNNVVKLIWEAYKEMKTASNTVDFSDILKLSLDLMKSGKAKPFNVHHILGDEAQDMDEVQHEWIAQHAKKGSLVTLCGDDDQSIYGFRFASGYEGMKRFLRELQSKTTVLPVNYRCGTDILALAAKLIENNTQRVDKPIKAAMPFPGKILRPIIGQRLTSKETGDFRRIKTNEFEAVVSDLQNEGVVSEMTGMVEWTILARTNLDLQAFSMFLREANIPYHTDRASIWDARFAKILAGILSYLASGEWVGMGVIIRSMIKNLDAFPFGDKTTLVELYKTVASGKSNILPEYPEFDSVVSTLKHLCYYESVWRGMMIKTNNKDFELFLCDVAQFVEDNFIDNAPMTASTRDNAIENLRDCIYALTNRLDNEPLKTRLRKVVNPVGRKDNSADYAKDKAKEENRNLFVTLMTMHKSKGLEFDNVYIIGSDDHTLLRKAPAPFSEERRLYYVAMTRARKTLGLSASCTYTQQPDTLFFFNMGFDPANDDFRVIGD